jgi:alginate O-acetyltransferase complex protein AlgI
MLFNSIHFLIFFPVVTLVYFLLRGQNLRLLFMLAASYYFYMSWKWEYGILLFLTTFVDYVLGWLMASAQSKAVKRLLLVLSLCSNLSVLFLFKYYNFFRDAFNIVLEAAHIPGLPPFKFILPSGIFLPVGISFYTFQSLSYTIDVYRGQTPAERNFIVFALYVSFFPQLVAGPIERSTHLLPQFRKPYNFDYRRTIEGLRLMLWGFFMKLCIADGVAGYVQSVYGHVHDYTGYPLLLATYLFAFQILCDFSAYSAIAIGSAKILGFDLMENFRRPYFAQSIEDFWRRWHISLSTWFKDYLYIPLGGSRVSTSRWCFNIMLVFLLSGLWHGAAWTFIAWGALHGVYMIAGRAKSGQLQPGSVGIQTFWRRFVSS